jgi:hypothetical protein
VEISLALFRRGWVVVGAVLVPVVGNSAVGVIPWPVDGATGGLFAVISMQVDKVTDSSPGIKRPLSSSSSRPFILSSSGKNGCRTLNIIPRGLYFDSARENTMEEALYGIFRIISETCFTKGFKSQSFTAKTRNKLQHESLAERPLFALFIYP